jgi:hypothetical protein
MTSRVDQDSLEKAVLGERPTTIHDPVSIEPSIQESPGQESENCFESDQDTD